MTLLTVATCLVSISVVIKTDQSSFQMYPSGVRSGNCGTSLDHVVLTAVFGTLSVTNYWKVKDSWRSSRGVSGYVLMKPGNTLQWLLSWSDGFGFLILRD